MSAYSASAPVTHRNTPPSTRKPVAPPANRNSTPCRGSSAHSTDGCRAIPQTPSAPITTNQSAMIGKALGPIMALWFVVMGALGWMPGDSPDTERAHHHEPKRHDRPERLADLRGALGLKREQRDQHCHGGRQYVGIERRRDHFQALE